MVQDIEKWPIGHFAFNAHFLSEHEGNAKTMKPSPLPRDGDHGFAAQWQRCRCEQYIKQASDIEDHGKGHRTKQNHVLKSRPTRRPDAKDIYYIHGRACRSARSRVGKKYVSKSKLRW